MPSIGEAAAPLLSFPQLFVYTFFPSAPLGACEGEDETRRRYGTFLLLLLAITGVDYLFLGSPIFFNNLYLPQ